MREKSLCVVLFLGLWLVAVLPIGCCPSGSLVPAVMPTYTSMPVPASPTYVRTVVCTPPLCNAGEVYHCGGDCPGGCGTLCATPTLPAPASVPCEPPPGWQQYTVQWGDTLYSLARGHSTSVEDIKNANCRSGDDIFAGELLWLPPDTTTPPTPDP